MYGIIFATLLVLILLHGHAQMQLTRSIANKLGLPHRSHLQLLTDSKHQTVVIEPAPVGAAAATTSAFASGPPDFMAHARSMDARVNSPAAKTEALLMNNDRAQRKLRAALVKGG